MTDTPTRRRPNAAMLAMPRSGIREIMDLTWGRDDVLRLEVGEPDFTTPGHIVEAAVEATRRRTGYTANQGTAQLREAVADKLGRVNGLAADPDEVVITVGAVNALFSTLRALVSDGDGVLVPDPGWPNYRSMIAMVGARALSYPLLAPTWEPDLDALDAAIRASDARVIIVNSPGNPTGGVWSAETTEAVMRLAAEHDLHVLSDEVYEEMVFDGAHHSPKRFDADGRVITISSCSKTYAMTGWRVGYLAADRTLAQTIAKLQEAVVACPNDVAQSAAVAALRGPQDAVGEMRAAYHARRDLAVAALREAGLLAGEPRGAFYAFADVSAATTDTMAFARGLVSDHGVSVAPGETFGPQAAGLVRLSLASSEDTIAEGIRRIARLVAEWPGA